MTQLPKTLKGTLHTEVVSVPWDDLARHLLAAYKTKRPPGQILEVSDGHTSWVPLRPSYGESLDDEDLQEFRTTGDIDEWLVRQLVYRAIEDGHLPNLPYIVLNR